MTFSSIIIAASRQNKTAEASVFVAEIEKLKNENISTGLKIFFDAANAEYAFACKNYLRTIEMYNKAYQKAVAAADPYTIAFTAEGLGRAYAEAGNSVVAENYLKKSLRVAKQNNYLSQQQIVLSSLSRLYADNSNFKLAWEYTDSLVKLKDSLALKINANRRLLLDAKYETSKKESLIDNLEADKKIQELTIKQKSVLNYILIGSAATILVISLLSYRNYRQKQKLQQQRINELETEKKLTATEAVLKGEEQERTRLAKDLHDGLGGMLSGIKYSFQTMKGNLIMTPDNAQAFERSMDMLDSSIKEMRRVAHNMMPEALVKFGLDTALKDFCNDINQTGAIRATYQSLGLENTVIEQTTAVTIYRIVQELINNTMKHAAAKTAIIQVSKTNGVISITVEDDGKGFNPVILQGTKGIGWSNIQSRVEYLKGKLDVQSEPGKGTSVHIELNT
jgi:signal transduction histidine kinase